MTITVTRLDFTKTIDAMVTGACQHAQHTKTPAQAVELYAITEDLNAVAKRIARSGLADILNSKLPGPGEPDEDTGVNAQILQLIADSDSGLTNAELADELDCQTATVRKMTAALCGAGKLAYIVEDQTKRYVLPGTRHSADVYAVAAEDVVDVPPAVVKILNSPAPRPQHIRPRKDEGAMYGRILDHIRTHPLCTKEEIALAMPLAATTVDYHVKRMVALGDIALDHQRRGRAHRYRIVDQPIDQSQAVLAPIAQGAAR